MALFILLAAAARAGIIAAHLLVHLDRRVGFLLAVGAQVAVASLVAGHVGLRTDGALRLLRAVLERNECLEEEGQDVLVERLEHRGEEVVALQLVDHHRVLLLVGSVLDALLEVVHLAEVLLPVLVDLVEDDILAQGLGDLAAF